MRVIQGFSVILPLLSSIVIVGRGEKYHFEPKKSSVSYSHFTL